MVSIRYLAQLAGVSHTTVSRALHGDSRVDPAIRERILALARKSRQGGTLCIGILLPALADPLSAPFLAGVYAGMQCESPSVLIRETGTTQAGTTIAITQLLAQDIAGLLAYAPGPEPLPRKLTLALQSQGLPIIAIRSSAFPFSVAHLHPDEHELARMVAEYLWHLGHRRIGYLGIDAPPDLLHRRDTICAVLQGLHCFHSQWVYTPISGPRPMKTLVETWMNTSPLKRATAIICGDDIHALQLMRECTRQGIRLPRELSILGIGNYPQTQFATPALTTVDLSMEQLGHTAYTLLLEHLQQVIDRTEESREIKLPGKLIIRDSCAHPILKAESNRIPYSPVQPPENAVSFQELMNCTLSAHEFSAGTGQEIADTRAQDTDHSLDGARRTTVEFRRQWTQPGVSKASAMRYQLQHQLGAGTDGQVFSALDTVLQREVAIKFLTPPHHDNPHTLQRCLEEARRLASLEHPNILPIHDMGLTDEGEIYLAMRKMTGMSLGAAIREAATGTPPSVIATTNDLLNILLRVCDAVAYAHDRGIIHQDIKPENIVLGKHGEVMLIDWGTVGESRLHEPRHDDLLGTPIYMSPEQARCEWADARSDIYCLGATLFYALTHRYPTWSPMPEIFWEKKRQGSIDPLTLVEEMRVSKRLLAIVFRALAPDPAYRYPSVQEFAEDIKRYQAGHIHDGWNLVFEHDFSRITTLDPRFIASWWDDDWQGEKAPALDRVCIEQGMLRIMSASHFTELAWQEEIVEEMKLEVTVANTSPEGLNLILAINGDMRTGYRLRVVNYNHIELETICHGYWEPLQKCRIELNPQATEYHFAFWQNGNTFYVDLDGRGLSRFARLVPLSLWSNDVSLIAAGDVSRPALVCQAVTLIGTDFWCRPTRKRAICPAWSARRRGPGRR